MHDGSRWPKEAWIPLLAGVHWLWNAPDHGVVGFLFSVLPGCLLLGGGLAMLLMPGDRRIAQFVATGGLLGVVFALPAFVVLGIGHGVSLVVVSALGFLAAGHHALVLEPRTEGVPEPEQGLALAAQVAADEVVLAGFGVAMGMPSREDHVRVVREVAAAREFFAERGWLANPITYHGVPPKLSDPELKSRRARGHGFEHLSFESGYEPHEGEPGRERWLSRAPLRTAHAWVLRHPGEDRPWLTCIHGYCMGHPSIDLAVFDPRHLHHDLGLNLILPILPLHGPRTIGRLSGDGYIKADVMDTIHAEAQAMWDLRRCLSWVRSQSDRPIGVYGLSLGGYNAALYAALDAELACVIAGIPLTDFASIVFRHGPELSLRTAREAGLLEADMRELKRVISPLDLPPKVAYERLHIFGAVADRLVPAEQVQNLWLAWKQPEIVWYQGAHVTFSAHRPVKQLIERSLASAGLTRATATRGLAPA